MNDVSMEMFPYHQFQLLDLLSQAFVFLIENHPNVQHNILGQTIVWSYVEELIRLLLFIDDRLIAELYNQMKHAFKISICFIGQVTIFSVKSNHVIGIQNHGMALFSMFPLDLWFKRCWYSHCHDLDML